MQLILKKKEKYYHARVLGSILIGRSRTERGQVVLERWPSRYVGAVIYWRERSEPNAPARLMSGLLRSHKMCLFS